MNAVRTTNFNAVRSPSRNVSGSDIELGTPGALTLPTAVAELVDQGGVEGAVATATAVAVPAASAAEDAISPNVTVAVRADAISNALARAGAGPPLALVASAETPASHSSARFGNIVSDEDHMRDILYAVASSPTAVGAASRYSLDELEMALFSYRHGLCV